MAVQVPRTVADLIRPDAPADDARDALGLGDVAVYDVPDFVEAVDDRVAALLVAGTGVTLTYSDVAGTLTVAAAGASVPDPLTVSTVQGSTASGGNLTLRSTSHATKGTVTVEGNLLTTPDSFTLGGGGAVAPGGTRQWNIGHGNILQTTGDNCLAVGIWNQINAPGTTNCTALGFLNTISANAYNSTAVGSSNTVSSATGFVLGNSCTLSGGGAVALGNGVVVSGYRSVGLGTAITVARAGALSYGAVEQDPCLLLTRYGSTGVNRDVGVVQAAWADSTDATRKGRLSLVACDASGTDKEGLSVSSNGTTADVVIPIANVRSAADDTAAAALSPAIPVGGLYRTASVLKIRVT